MVIFFPRVGKMDVKLGGSEINLKSKNVTVLIMKFSISRNVPRPARYILHAFPASHGPYSEKSENPGE